MDDKPAILFERFGRVEARLDSVEKAVAAERSERREQVSEIVRSIDDLRKHMETREIAAERESRLRCEISSVRKSMSEDINGLRVSLEKTMEAHHKSLAESAVRHHETASKLAGIDRLVELAQRVAVPIMVAAILAYLAVGQ